MKTLELLLGFWCLSVSLAELNLHLIEVSFHLLLQSESFIPAASLWFQWALQGINHSLLVPLGLLHLFIFLSQLTFISALIWLNSSWALSILPSSCSREPYEEEKICNLKKCQMNMNFGGKVLFFFYLGLLQSRLYLLFLLLQLFPNFLQLMNILPTLTKLLSEVRDFLYAIEITHDLTNARK